MTTEEKIHIAASFDSEKIKMIRELMEEENSEFIYHLDLTETSIENIEKRECIKITEKQAKSLMSFWGKGTCEKANLKMWITASLNKPNKQ